MTIPTRIVEIDLPAALFTSVHVPAQDGGTTVGEVRSDAVLECRDWELLGICFEMGAKNVGYFKVWTRGCISQVSQHLDGGCVGSRSSGLGVELMVLAATRV